MAHSISIHPSRMKTLLAWLALTLVVSASSFADSSDSDEPASISSDVQDIHLQLAKRRAACGFNCLYLFLRLSDTELDTAQLEEHLPVSDEGNSMLSLKQAASQFGVSTAIVRVDGQNLHRLAKPLILLTDSQRIDELSITEAGQSVPDFSRMGHYFLVTESTERQVELIDGTTGHRFTQPLDEIRPEWILAALIAKPPTDYWRWQWVVAIACTLLTIAVFTLYPKSPTKASQVD